MASPSRRPLAVLDLPAAPYRIHPALESLAVPLKKLQALEGNPRRGDVDAVMRSYRVFGQRKPIVARRLARGRGEVIAGNHQLAAAGELGWPDIAVVFVDEDELRSKAFAIADNRAGDLATNDAEALAAMLSDVSVDEMLMAAASFTQDELDAMLAELAADDAAPALNDRDSVRPPPSARSVASRRRLAARPAQARGRRRPLRRGCPAAARRRAR